MSVNRILIFLVVAGYVLVNVNMQLDFFAGHSIFDKYQVATNAGQALVIAQQAYYAKTAFLLMLLVLLTLNVPFALGFAVSFLAYAIAMLVFFGPGKATTIYLVASLALLASYVLERFRTGRR
jgi:ABC-type polysaccharide/polyol phosphate export permease